jgi:hypothetical protein
MEWNGTAIRDETRTNVLSGGVTWRTGSTRMEGDDHEGAQSCRYTIQGQRRQVGVAHDRLQHPIAALFSFSMLPGSSPVPLQMSLCLTVFNLEDGVGRGGARAAAVVRSAELVLFHGLLVGVRGRRWSLGTYYVGRRLTCDNCESIRCNQPSIPTTQPAAFPACTTTRPPARSLFADHTDVEPAMSSA